MLKSASKKILLSGVKPTGRPHIGNYFGAMKQFVDLQNASGTAGDFSCHLFIADYHGLNFIQNADEMRQLTLELALDYLAIGLDPAKSVIFKQSDVSAHTELAWIFDTIVTVPYLMLAHAFKARVGQVFFDKNPNFFNEPINPKEDDSKHVRYDDEVKRMYSGINVGTFNYPVLMAADILLYDTDVVPVGQDQKQHIEYSRDIAEKFNHIFKTQNGTGETFKLPEPLIMKEVATVPGIDGRKMSKSYGNTIPLFASREEVIKAVMGIVTDSGGATGAATGATGGDGIPANVYSIHKLFKTEAELKALYDMNKGKYKVLKEALIEDIDAFIKPLRERRAAIAGNIDEVKKILANGAQKAQEKADKKLIEVKKAIGVL